MRTRWQCGIMGGFVGEQAGPYSRWCMGWVVGERERERAPAHTVDWSHFTWPNASVAGSVVWGERASVWYSELWLCQYIMLLLLMLLLVAGWMAAEWLCNGDSLIVTADDDGGGGGGNVDECLVAGSEVSARVASLRGHHCSFSTTVEKVNGGCVGVACTPSPHLAHGHQHHQVVGRQQGKHTIISTTTTLSSSSSSSSSFVWLVVAVAKVV